MTDLAFALIAFVGTHFLLSHPFRARFAARLGAAGFQIFYSVVAFVTLGWAGWAFWQAPIGAPLWSVGEGLWALGTVIMFFASVLLAGSFVGNPALPAPGTKKLAMQEPRGVFAITRHPMMWSFALWSLTHVLVSPRPPVILLSAAMALLALGGAAGQDAKKRVLMGDAWKHWQSRTAFVPFANQLAGRTGWAIAWPGPIALAGGTILWLVATYAHPWIGAPLAGIWYWLI